MDLRRSYTLFAPLYDCVVAHASAGPRQASLARLAYEHEILIAGIGTGLDIPYLPRGPHYTGIDLTPAMLRVAERRARMRDDVSLQVGDVMALPYADESFDAVVMHLILAVVPAPERALREAERVLRPGGRVLILDKFLRRGQRAPLRRALNIVSRRIATRTDVVFEDVLACCPSLCLEQDEPALVRGWFRRIELRKCR